MAAKKITKKKKKVIVTLIATTLTFLVSVLLPADSPIKTGIYNFVDQISSIIITSDDNVIIPDTTFIY